MEATRYFAIAQRWWWLLIIGVLMAVAAYGIASRVRDRQRQAPAPVFSASVTLFVMDDHAAVLDASGAASPSQTLYSDRLLNSYVELIKSPPVAQRVIDRLGLAVPIAEVQRRLAVVALPGTQLIQVTATAGSPGDAALLVDGVVQAYLIVHAEGHLPGNTYVSGVAPSQQAATPPAARSEWSIVLMVAVFGLLSSAAIIVAFEFLTNTVRDSTDAEAATGVPVLAAIPMWSAGKNGRIASAIVGRRAGEAAERFRMLRTAIRLKTKDQPAQVLLFSGAGAAAGTTTTAANYAFALAQAGRRVVIVDANLREPAQHRMFGVVATPGLADALASSQVSLDSILRTTSIDNISLVPAGLCPANPSELLESARFDAMLAGLRGRFDAIVIDSPPVLAATDATLLAARADATVLVVRSDQTARPNAAAAVEMLGHATSRIMGVVLNRETSAPRRRPIGSGIAAAQNAEARAQ
jgi:capsular exopolysaccharide synthesis family protein